MGTGEDVQGEAKLRLQPMHFVIENQKDLMENQLFLQNTFSLHGRTPFSPNVPQFPLRKWGRSHAPASPACLCGSCSRGSTHPTGGWFLGLRAAQDVLTASGTAAFLPDEHVPHTSACWI